jgi:hypothetical protein
MFADPIVVDMCPPGQLWVIGCWLLERSIAVVPETSNQ